MKQTRNTPQRKLVQRILQNNKEHPTADDVYQQARQENPAISRGTVYRNLSILAENGDIIRLHMPLGPDHYDGQTHNHYHFLCHQCNRVLDTGLEYDESLNKATPNVEGCKTEWHKLILVGLCPACNKND